VVAYSRVAVDGAAPDIEDLAAPTALAKGLLALRPDLLSPLMVAVEKPQTDSPTKAFSASSKSSVDTPFGYNQAKTHSRRRLFFRDGAKIRD